MIWAALIAIAVIGYGAQYLYKGRQQDNVIEETAEEFIQQQTGIKIDLTPETPEGCDNCETGGKE